MPSYFNTFSFLLGVCFAVFNRFAARIAVDIQVNTVGTRIADPEKTKRIGRWFFLAAGLFFMITSFGW
jgi:hypothetical protein